MPTAEELRPKFRARFPEFATTSDDDLDDFLEDALAIHTGSNRATLYLSAHLITICNDSGVGSTGAGVDGGDGEVTAETVGRESVSVMAQAERGNDAFYTTTAYGRKYLAFAKASPSRVFSCRVV